MDRYLALVKAVTDFWLHKVRGISYLSEKLLVYLEELCYT